LASLVIYHLTFWNRKQNQSTKYSKHSQVTQRLYWKKTQI